MIMKPETFQPHFIRSHFTIMEEFKGFKRKQKNKLTIKNSKLFLYLELQEIFKRVLSHEVN